MKLPEKLELNMCTLFHLIYVFGYGLLRIYVCHIDTSGQRRSNAFGKLGSKNL